MVFRKIFFSLCLLASSCGKVDLNSSFKPTVLVSISPYKSFVEKIGGDALEVRPVIPLQANPHVFEPTSRQVKEIFGADIWFRIGEPFEEKVLSVLKDQKSPLFIYDLRKEIPLLEKRDHCCGSLDSFDRHIWLNPKLAALQAQAIANVLKDKFPEKKDFFEKNLKELEGELQALDDEIHLILASSKGKSILVSHPAFSYFCNEYEIEQLSVEFEEKEPGPQHLEKLLSLAVEKHTAFAIALPQHNNKGAQLIAKKLHLPVRWIDPYTSDYFEMMRTLANLIANPQYQP